MFCVVCLKDSTLVCSGCKATYYCSANCQQLDWRRSHKRGCKIQQQLNQINAEMAAKPSERPPVGKCTGCNVKFSEKREVYCDSECETCGYQACESCAVDHTEGTCYCPNSNFGNSYCEMEPRWYHTNGRGVSYKGDRHPEGYGEYEDETYEPEPRACNNCGKVTKVLKKEYM
ncbi:hypothetical protein CERSUDRAFT_150285 [Gelatoporia subvermispora B]|uniref:MYND-type domain-containing protein n=1 Tax=Ceriporiopsis subvermispora (strain B) TaxID=914234 RepID=M2RLE2_CERS8|nr:hypothetical protein CERSUDRAFT_150285 [Gelatoporia subvermispora B]